MACSVQYNLNTEFSKHFSMPHNVSNGARRGWWGWGRVFEQENTWCKTWRLGLSKKQTNKNSPVCLSAHVYIHRLPELEMREVKWNRSVVQQRTQIKQKQISKHKSTHELKKSLSDFFVNQLRRMDFSRYPRHQKDQEKHVSCNLQLQFRVA